MKIKFEYEDNFITMKLKVKGEHSIEFIGSMYKAILKAESEILSEVDKKCLKKKNA